MPIAAEAQTVDPRLTQALFVGGLTAAGLIAAVAAGIWRVRAVRGPERLPASVPAAPWMLVTIAAAGAWMLAQSAYVGAIASRQSHAATQASTAPAVVQFSPADLAVLSTVPPAIGAAIMLFGATLAWPGLARQIGIDARRIVPGAAPALVGTMIALPLVMWLLIGLEWLYNAIGYLHPTQHEMLRKLGETSRPATRIAIIAGATVAAPVFEELLFRGGVQTLLRRALGGIRHRRDDDARPASVAAVWGAILLASLLFAMIHEPWMAPAIFALSVCLGYAYERTGNLWVPILMHAIFNIINVVASVYAAG